jgi:hypothetical protein
MSKVKHWYKCAAAIILCFACLMMGCTNQSLSKEELAKYTEYVCYDSHLVCLKSGKYLGRTDYPYYREYESSGKKFEYTITVKLWKIPKESEDQFVYAHAFRPILDVGRRVVMQNPDNYVDVLSTWNIEKLELYCLDRSDIDKERNPKKKVIETTSDSTCISELVSFALSELDPEKIEKFKTMYSVNSGGYYDFYVRAYFSESEYIAWDAEADLYFDKESEQKLVMLRIGRKSDADLSPNMVKYSIEGYSTLSNWISDAIEAFAAKS